MESQPATSRFWLGNFAARITRQPLLLLVSLSLILAASLICRGGSLPEPAGKRLIQPFDYRGVTLGPGPLQAQVDEVRNFYLAIPDDDLLKGFRTRAGRPAPGRELGGWYSSDTFLVFGQIVSGLARLHAGTGDVRCREKANHLIAEWGKCIAPDGYFYPSPKPNAPHYIYDKMLWGLLDVHQYCGNEEALQHLSRITDWAIKNLNRSRRVNDTSTEWYTLSENLYRAYLATGDVKYRDFAEVWEYHAYWDIYARGDNIFAPRPDGTRSASYHAYSHVNTLGGAATAFLVKGEKHYLDTVVNAADFLEQHQCFATGGFGPDEQLLPANQRLERLGQTHNTFETQCGSWAVFKLAKYLLTFTGNARYGDWIERLVINGVGASIPMTADGRVFYYSDYCLYGGVKRNTDFGWSCCTGTRPQAVADFHDLIYFHDAQNLYVNLFASSTVKWPRATGVVTVTQTTRFPESDEVRLTVAVATPAEFGLRFRVPSWLASPMSASINGHEVDLQRDGNGWATLRREWKDGDEVVLRLPMRLWSSPLDRERPTPAAALFGPVVLAFSAPNARTLQAIDVSALDHALSPVAGEPLRFKQVSDPAVRARPFFAIPAGEEYFIYLDPKMGSRIPDTQVKFTGKWQNGGAFRFSNEVGASAECKFEGEGVRWLGRRFDDAGRAEVAIDGQVVGIVDQYGPGRDLPFNWSHGGLSPGRHTIQLRIVPEKSEKSTNRFLNVIGFEVLSAERSAAEPVYHAGTTHKILQITGDRDVPAGVPTISRTQSRAGVIGTDLGSSFEHKGQLCFLFGDTRGRPGDVMDCFAFSTSTDPEKLEIKFPLAADRKFLPIKIPGISQGGMEVPSGGISLLGKIYLVFTTDWHEPTGNMERSVMARSDDDGRTWKRLYNLSAATNHDMANARFVNVSMAAVKEPEPAGPKEAIVLIWGTGAYRKSDPYLAMVPASQIEDRAAIRFYTGIDSHGDSRWSPREADALPLFEQPQLGEFSVAWIAAVNHWVMLYNADKPRGITMRTAPKPRGPWSAGHVILDPWKDGAYGKYMHVSWKFTGVPHDHFSDPGRENEWGGEYGPYLIPRFTRGDARRCQLFYTMSTWNPYQTILVTSEIGEPESGTP